MHRQDHDVHFGIGRDDLAGRLDSIELRHRDVDDGDPGSQTENLCHGFAAVGRRSNDLHVRVRGQQRSQAIPQDSVIIGHEYRSTHRLPSTTLDYPRLPWAPAVAWRMRLAANSTRPSLGYPRPEWTAAAAARQSLPLARASWSYPFHIRP